MTDDLSDLPANWERVQKLLESGRLEKIQNQLRTASVTARLYRMSPTERELLVFLRACDLNGIVRVIGRIEDETADKSDTDEFFQLIHLVNIMSEDYLVGLEAFIEQSRQKHH